MEDTYLQLYPLETESTPGLVRTDLLGVVVPPVYSTGRGGAGARSPVATRGGKYHAHRVAGAAVVPWQAKGLARRRTSRRGVYCSLSLHGCADTGRFVCAHPAWHAGDNA